jgi:hypothetical protein
MDKQFSSLLSVVIIPQVVDLIAVKENISEKNAIEEFYDSQVYKVLEREETKVWHYSPLTIYFMWKSEKETGEIAFPEEC